MGLLDQTAELARATAARDTKFYRQLLYYFELRVPPAVRAGPDNPFLFPLVVPPESYRLSEPFTVDRAHTLGGGLFVEEQGIVAREITLSGNTGWAPRRFPPGTSNLNAIATPRHRSYTRNVAHGTGSSGQDILLALSGQRHLQFLQDAVFRTYGDLKQDPSTSAQTELYFHIPKDDEHWRVIPLAFSLDREANNPLLYRYTISLLAVAPAPAGTYKFSEDFNILSTLKDAYRVMRSGITIIESAIADLTGVTGELRVLSAQFNSLMDGAAAVAGAAANFVDGVSTLVAIPFNTALATVQAGLDALLELNTGYRQSSSLGAGANLLNSIRRVVDGVQMIASYPGSFQNDVQAAVAAYQARTSASNTNRADALVAAASNAPPATLRSWEQMGSQLLPGAAARARDDLGLGRFTPAYTSAWQYVLEQGDTLANLAARFLDDARNWKYLAVFNSLQPPFISTEGLPGTLRVGDRLLIPSFAQTTVDLASVATLGVRPEAPPAEHVLGTDLRVDPVGVTGLYDLVIDVEGGSTDLKLVAGVTNLKQAIRTRLITERGSDTLYRQLGCSRLVGLGVDALDLETAQFRLVDAIQADPRIVAVRALTFDQDQPDSVVADVTAEVRGFARPERIQVTA
jgi:hypothetical protein